MKYKVKIKKSVIKSLKKIPKEDQKKIVKVIKLLEDEPRPSTCSKLTCSDYYRIRCGLYRIIYDIKDDVLIVVVLKVGHRKDIYTSLPE